MISGSLCGQLVAQQSISEMGSSKNTKASGVLAHVHVNLNVPTFSAVQIDHGLLKMNVQSMLDDFQVKLMSRDSLESIAESDAGQLERRQSPAGSGSISVRRSCLLLERTR